MTLNTTKKRKKGEKKTSINVFEGQVPKILDHHELLKKNQEIKEELEYIKKTSETQMYINDLDALRSELSGDFK